MKKLYLLLIILSFFCFLNNAKASTQKMNRTEENHYGVNKKWDMNEKRIRHALNTPYVDASEKVYDFSNILTPEEEEELYQIILEYEELTGFSMVFVSDNISYSNDKKNEDYAADFYDYNDFGLENPYYSGVVIFRNTYKADPYYGIYYFGEAQLYYSNIRNDVLLDSIYDDFHSANYMKGLEKLIKKMRIYYKQGKDPYMKHYTLDENGVLTKKYVPPFLIATILSGIVTAIFLGITISKNKMVKKAVVATEYLNRESISITEKKDQFLHSHVTHYTISTSSGSGSSRGGHVGSSGGGHSGGGRHG